MSGKMKKIYTTSKDEAKTLDTTKLRERFLIDSIYIEDSITYNYTYYDRLIVGGIMPKAKTLELNLSTEIGTEFFLERREIGFINVGGKAEVNTDDEKYTLNNLDGLYVGTGTKKVTFKSLEKSNPAKIYYISTMSNVKHPNAKIDIAKASPLKMGNSKDSNKRTIYKFFHPDNCKTTQLLMGITLLDEGNVWNTMPPHTHERRTEAYFYFDMEKETRVFHIMGEASETRHIVVANEEAVISAPWSIHGGVGTGGYAFIWAMGGENQTFSDMQKIKVEELK